MRWRDIIIGALSTLGVTIFGGIVVYYLTQAPSGQKQELLLYSIEPPAAFETAASNVALQNISVANRGRITAKNVTIAIDLANNATIKDKSVTSSTGPASGVVTIDETPTRLVLSVNSLIPDERIKISLLLASKPTVLPSVSIKSDASTGQLELSAADAKPGKAALARFLVVMIPALMVLQVALVAYVLKRHFFGRHPKAPNNTAFVLLHGGDFTKAQQVLTREIENGMADGYVFSNYALCLALNGDFDAADSHIRMSEFFDSSDYTRGVRLFNSSLVAFLKGDVAGGMTMLRRAIQLRKVVVQYCNYSSVFKDIRVKHQDEVSKIPELSKSR